MTQRKRWLKTREFEKGECVAVRRPGKADTDRNAKRPPFVCILVWVYFVHERFESGFRDLTLCQSFTGLLAFEALQGLPRPVRGTHGRSYCGRNRL